MALVKLMEPRDEGELAFVRSLLDGNGIPYFVHNEHFGSLYPGLPLPFNRRTVMVNPEDLGRAAVLIKGLAFRVVSDRTE